VQEVEQILISGKKFKKLRLELVLTQQEMAEEIGMSVSGLRAVERKPASKVGNKYIRALANLRKIPPAQQQAELTFDSSELIAEPSDHAALIAKVDKAADGFSEEEVEQLAKIVNRAVEKFAVSRGGRIIIGPSISGR